MYNNSYNDPKSIKILEDDERKDVQEYIYS